MPGLPAWVRRSRAFAWRARPSAHLAPRPRVLVRDDHARMLRDVADDGVAAIADRHVLHLDGRLAMAAVAVERLDLGRKGAGKPAQRARGAVVLGESSACAR